MKLSALYAPESSAFAQLAGLLTLGGILYAFYLGKLLLVAIPAGLAVMIALVIVPKAIAWIFLASFFWGHFVIHRHFVGVTVTDILFVLFCLAYASRFLFVKGSYRMQAPNSAIMKVLVPFCIWTTASYVLNIYYYDGIQALMSLWSVVKCLQMALFFWIAFDAFKEVNTRQAVFLIYALCLLQIPVALGQFYIQSSGYLLQDRERIIGTLTYHHSMLGTMMLFGIALSLYYILESQRWLQKLIHAAAAVLFLVIIVISGTRSALVGIPLAVFVWAVMEFRSRPKHVSLVMGCGILFSVAIAMTPIGQMFIHRITTLNTGFVDISALSRLYIWEGAVLHFISMSWWEKLIGVGVGAYFIIPYPFVLWAGLRHALGAHNNILHVLLETGIIGLVLFCALFFVILRELHRRARNSRLAFVYFYLTIALLGSGISQETFWFQKAFGSLWLFYLAMLVFILRDEPAGQTMPQRGF